MKIVLAILILGLVYVLQRGLYQRYWNKGLKVSLGFDSGFLECGEDTVLKIEIENRKLLPLPVFHLKYTMDRSLLFSDNDNSTITDLNYRNDVFSILGNQRIIRKHVLRGGRRGVFYIPGCTVHVKDFFLVTTFAEQVNTDSKIYVFPKKITGKGYDDLMNGIMGEILVRRSLIPDNMSFRGIREYMITDSQRSINWKQTARRNDLMVNLYDYTMDREIRLLLNLDTHNMIEPAHLLEETISLTSSAARSFLRKKVGVSLKTNGRMKSPDDPDRFITNKPVSDKGSKSEIPCPEIGRGTDYSHLVTVDKILSAITSTSGSAEFLKMLDIEMKSSLSNVLYFVISPYYKEDLLEKLDRMERLGMNVMLIVPYYDKMGFEPTRRYMRGWEVKFDEI